MRELIIYYYCYYIFNIKVWINRKKFGLDYENQIFDLPIFVCMNACLYERINGSFFFQRRKKIFQYMKMMKSNFDRVHIDDDSDLSSAKCKRSKTTIHISIWYISYCVPKAASAFFFLILLLYLYQRRFIYSCSLVCFVFFILSVFHSLSLLFL